MAEFDTNIAEQPKKRTAVDIMAEAFAMRPKEPGYDANRPRELKRLAKNSVIAKGISLLGDTAALAMGANVNRKRPDNSEKQYLSSMYDYMDNYQKRLDDWNWRDFSAQLNMKGQEAQQANADRNFDNQNEKYAQNFEYQKANRENDLDWRTKQFDAQQEQQRISNERADKQQSMMQGYYNKRGSNSSTGTDRNIKIETKSGKVYSLTPEKLSYLRNQVRNLPEAQMLQFRKTNPNLFEKVIGEPMYRNGVEIQNISYQPARGVGEDDFVRALLEIDEQPKVNTNGYEAFYGKGGDKGQPQQTKSEQKPEYTTGGYY